jgi:hypothetical protein
MIEISIIQLWLAVATLIVGGVGATITAVWTISNKIRDIETTTDKKLKEHRDEAEERLKEAIMAGDEKRGRIYQRFDEYKTHFEANFVRRELCSLLHADTAKAVSRIIEEVSALKKDLSEIKEIVLTLKVEHERRA